MVHSQFEESSALIAKLGLPMNPDKRTPPTRRLTCLGIPIGPRIGTKDELYSKFHTLVLIQLMIRLLGISLMARNLFFKFPTIDNIISQIKATQVKVLLAKIDIARAFRNLHVDPADTFKFGVKQQGKYYLDFSVSFGLLHGSVVFQLVSDAISDSMSHQGCHIFAYIDNYI